MDLISEDKQVLFDTAIRKLAEQGRKSWSKFSCKYQEGANRCAIGWLMTDQKIALLRDAIGSIGRLIEDKRFSPGSVSVDFLQDLQSIHDAAYSSINFREKAFLFAVDHGLSPDIVHQVLTPEWCQNTNWCKPTEETTE